MVTPMRRNQMHCRKPMAVARRTRAGFCDSAHTVRSPETQPSRGSRESGSLPRVANTSPEQVDRISEVFESGPEPFRVAAKQFFAMGAGNVAVSLEPTELYRKLLVTPRTLNRQIEVGAKIREIGCLFKRVDSGHAGSLTFCVAGAFN